MYQWIKDSSILKPYFRVANKLIMLYARYVNILYIIITYFALCNIYVIWHIVLYFIFIYIFIYVSVEYILII